MAWMKESRSSTQYADPWVFFALAMALSWLFLIPLAWLGEDPMRFPYLILMILGGLGPAMAEIILVFGLGSRGQRHDYRQRVFDIRRIGWGWFVVILLIFPVLNVGATDAEPPRWGSELK
jgi:hypothetical protein